MNIFRKPRHAANDEPGPKPVENIEAAGDEDFADLPPGFVKEDFEDEFEGEGWSFWGD